MSMAGRTLLALVLLQAAARLFAEESGVVANANPEERWYAGATIGLFDVDYEDGDLPHFDSTAYSAFVGYDLHRFIGLELAVDQITEGSGDRDGNLTSSFEAVALSPTLLLKYPFQESAVEAYFRVGGSWQDYRLQSINSDGVVEDRRWTTALGGGLRGEHFFLEYLVYGEEQELIMEQLRLGLRFRW